MHKKFSIIFFFLKWLFYVNREYSIKREFSSYQHYFVLRMRIWELQKLNNLAKSLWFMNGKTKIVNQVLEVQDRALLQSLTFQRLTSMKGHHKSPGAWWVVWKRPRQQKWLLGRAMLSTKDPVMGKGCYSWYGGALAPLFSTFTEPDWDKCGRKKAAHPKERRDHFQRLISQVFVTWERLVVVNTSFPSIYWFKHVDQLTVR